ncbi:MAG: site-specific DNA-methyltransferase [Planctomycetota bacterium]
MGRESSAAVIFGDSRFMDEVRDGEIDLVVTSPPYWHIKDYGKPGQIGYGQSLHEYLKDLYRVWSEAFRVLRPGGRICINIGDQFARSIIYGRYKVIPLHAEVIGQCERLGLDFMGSIIWQKKTTMNTTGGATVMGSFPYPPNGIVEIDYEYIHILKKQGPNKKIASNIKTASRLTKEEWKEYFSGHWYFGGIRQNGHEAMFPEELPRRLIRMFSFEGDTVLDPFLGSGTTIKAALNLNRNAVGYELNLDFLSTIREKLGLNNALPGLGYNVRFVEHHEYNKPPKEVNYEPAIQDAKPRMEPDKLNFKGERLYQVVEISDTAMLVLHTGLDVKLLGVKVRNLDSTLQYLRKYVLGKEISLRFENGETADQPDISAYVYLKNKIFVNAYLIKSGLAEPDQTTSHRLKTKFERLWHEGIPAHG